MQASHQKDLGPNTGSASGLHISLPQNYNLDFSIVPASGHQSQRSEMSFSPPPSTAPANNILSHWSLLLYICWTQACSGLRLFGTKRGQPCSHYMLVSNR